MANVTRRTWLTTFFCMLALVLVAGITMPATASAGCCTQYNVLIQNSVIDACLPLTVTTDWANGLTGTTTQTTQGLVTLPAPNPPGCWVTLTGITINGVTVPPPFTGQTVNLGGGCKVSVGILSTFDGCVTIVIF